MNIASDEEFLRLPEVKRRTGLGHTEIYERMKAGEFPRNRPYPGTNKVFWLASEVRAWQAKMLAAA